MAAVLSWCTNLACKVKSWKNLKAPNTVLLSNFWIILIIIHLKIHLIGSTPIEPPVNRTAGEHLSLAISLSEL